MNHHSKINDNKAIISCKNVFKMYLKMSKIKIFKMNVQIYWSGLFQSLKSIGQL